MLVWYKEEYACMVSVHFIICMYSFERALKIVLYVCIYSCVCVCARARVCALDLESD
jgi:hypothetical protein